VKVALAIAALALACGCTLTGCSEPLRDVNGECCLDGNLNGVCDDDESGLGVGECQLPYILYGGECCLDSNGNRVCDNLEGSVDVPSTTVEESSTTITLSPSSATSTSTEPPSTTASTSTTAYSTTTSTGARRPCYDSDGGENTAVLGTTSGRDRVPPHINVTFTDRCRTNGSVQEYRCEGEYVYSKELVCSAEKTCYGGRCCTPSGDRCGTSSECCTRKCVKNLYVGLCA